MNLSYEEHYAIDKGLIKPGVVEVGGVKVKPGGKLVTTDANEDNLGNLRQLLVKAPTMSFAETKKIVYPEPKKADVSSTVVSDATKNLLGPQNNN